MQNSIHAGHRNRLRQEFNSSSDQAGLPEHKLLEMLLFYGIPQRDTNAIAHELINTFGSFNGVFEADITSLSTVSGMTRNAATLIKLMIPLAAKYINCRYGEALTLKTVEEVGEFLLNKYFGCTVEKCSLLFLNNSGKVLGFNFLSEGDLDSVEISVRTIIERTLQVGASGVILSHNHPAGVPLPSRADVLITAEIANALSTVSVKLCDHIIISGNNYVSMANSERYKELFD